MRLNLRRFLLGAAFLTAAATQPAHAQSSAIYVITYIDVLPNAVTPSVTLLKTYRTASRAQNGSLRLDVLQEISRSNRFAVVEAWNDRAALDSHNKADTTLGFRNKLTAIEAAPYDERITNALFAGHGKSVAGPHAVYVVTHVDVIPSGKDDCMAAFKTMSADTANDPGNISYEVLQQTNRGNHFTVTEAWADRKSLDAHALTPHVRAFREKLTPIAGALYDERFYKSLD